MRATRVLGVGAVLALVAAMSVLPVQVRERPVTEHVGPNSLEQRHRVGRTVILDAGASAGVTDVQFELTGGSLSDSVIATAVPTYYGWIAEWNSTTVANGSYTLQSVATEGGSKTTSPSISMTVNKPPPTVPIVVPSSGATVSGTRPCSTPSPHRG